LINALNGKLVQVSEKSLVINVSGVEYFLEISTTAASYYSSLPKEQDVRVIATLVVREDAMLLYGFKDTSERECFLSLQTVSGIGPKQALKILSSVSVEAFIKALDERNVSLLSKIPGIGSKTAQKLILQLRDTLVYTDSNGTSGSSSSDNKAWKDILDSLADMGHERKTVQKKLDELLKAEGTTIYAMPHGDAESYVFTKLLRSL